MNKIFTASALTAVLAFGAFAEAHAWERNGTVTGPRGTSTFSGSGSCSGGTCTRERSRTGAYGRTVTRQGERTCANGTCTGSRTTTGPNGQTVTRQGSISR